MKNTQSTTYLLAYLCTYSTGGGGGGGGGGSSSRKKQVIDALEGLVEGHLAHPSIAGLSQVDLFLKVTHPPTHPPTHLLYLCTHIHPPTHLSTYSRPTHASLSIHPPIHPPTHLPSRPPYAGSRRKRRRRRWVEGKRKRKEGIRARREREWRGVRHE